MPLNYSYSIQVYWSWRRFIARFFNMENK